METATQLSTPTPRLSLAGRVLRPRRIPEAQGTHLHFDRTARAWRAHEELELLATAAALPECA